jgi:hypothetical protein
MALAQGMIECDRLQGVLQSRSHPHPLVSVPQQGSQVPLFDRGHPNLGNAILHHQQVQYQAGVAPIMFLFSGFGGTDLGRSYNRSASWEVFQLLGISLIAIRTALQLGICEESPR